MFSRARTHLDRTAATNDVNAKVSCELLPNVSLAAYLGLGAVHECLNCCFVMAGYEHCKRTFGLPSFLHFISSVRMYVQSHETH